MKLTVSISDITIQHDFASARVNISYHTEGKSFDSFGTLTYVLTEPELIGATPEKVEPTLRGFVLGILNNVI